MSKKENISMINLITGEQFAAAAIDVQFREFTTEELLADEPTGDFLRKFLLEKSAIFLAGRICSFYE